MSDDSRLQLDGTRLSLHGDITRSSVPDLFQAYRRRVRGPVDVLDLTAVSRIDNPGVAFLEHVRDASAGEARFEGAGDRVAHMLELFGSEPATGDQARAGEPVLVRLGTWVLRRVEAGRDALNLAADVVYHTLIAPFERSSRRRGSVSEQCDRIGVRAVPIVSFLALVLGIIVVLQSAAQLQRFGAVIFVVDLLGISLTRETAPLFTAIIVAGRSGSAIAAQLATMRVTEELDALEVMALDPVRYVIVPMMLGMLLTIPLLTALAVLVGLVGGLAIAVATLEISAEAFMNRLVEIVGFTDIFVGIAKSFFFGGAIVLTGSYFGLTAHGGSEGVGAATTRSVVASIFTVIVLNAVFSLLYLV
ncbi:MAG: ABC transporter permease [Spirochaetota bacterium]